MVNTNMVEAVCPECGSKIRINKNLECAVCFVCCQKFAVKDAINENISKDYIEWMDGEEFDRVVKNVSNLDNEKLKLAATKGSILASIELGSRFLLIENYKNAKAYFDLTSTKKIPDSMFASLVCEYLLSENPNTEQFIIKTKPYLDYKFRYLSKKASDELNRLVRYHKSLYDLASAAINFLDGRTVTSTYDRTVSIYYPDGLIDPEEKNTDELLWVPFDSGEVDLSGTTPLDWGDAN